MHGGEKFKQSVIIDDEVIKGVEECSDLAPLHNPANLIGVNVCRELMPGVPMVGVFDTAFHQTMPKRAYMYAIPYEWYEKYKIRRYGFHGTSHSFVSKECAKFLGLDYNKSRIIVCHLGNGSSISAIKNGRCVDTSMGLTPLAGMIMGTRSGDIDPAIIEYIHKKENLSIEEIMEILNKKSGVYGLSRGLSSDFRDLDEAADEGNPYAKLALEEFAYYVVKYIGEYMAILNGVDAIAFTAGIGENSAEIREFILSRLYNIGIMLDKEKNNAPGDGNRLISPADANVKVCVIPTNEELAIARDTVALVKKQ